MARKYSVQLLDLHDIQDQPAFINIEANSIDQARSLARKELSEQGHVEHVDYEIEHVDLS